MTNFEKIKKMDITQFSEFLDKRTVKVCNYCKHLNYCEKDCQKYRREWLESEAADDDSM